MSTEDLNAVLRARRTKLDQLAERGIAPFAYRYERTHDARRAIAALGDGSADALGPEVRVAGRLVAWRAHGKTTFAHLADRSGRLQLYFRQDELGEERYAALDLLDLGDVIGVAGPVFRTRTGEATVRVKSYELLAKSLRPLPFGKEEVVDGRSVLHSGFADAEQRSRQRYADLAVHPDVRDLFVARSRMVSAIRRFLDGRDFIEVETPVLQPLYGGAAARPFVTHHEALDMPLYLRIADELYLKRLIVGGLERVYEVGHDFRNEGIDRTHNPEFTMLEFYQAYADYNDMMTVVESLLVSAADAVRAEASLEERVPVFRPPFPRVQWVPALNTALGADAMSLDMPALCAAGERLGIEHVATLSRPKLLDELFQALVEAQLDAPTFVIDYPRELSPLAKPKR